MTSAPDLDLSVIIVSFNTRDILNRCLEHLIGGLPDERSEVIVVDNASSDGSADSVEALFPSVRLLRSESNLGFAAANNLAIGQARGRYLLLLNPDTILSGDAVEQALQRLDCEPGIAMVGARLRDEAGADQPSARLFPSLLNEFLSLSGLADRFPASRFFGRGDRRWCPADREALVDWVPGAFALLRRSALDQVGLFDERFFLYYEEVDLCRRLHAAGWQIAYWPTIEVMHVGGASSRTITGETFSSSGAQLTLWRMRSALLYYRKHHGRAMAWCISRLEMIWHRLRRLRASLPWRRAASAERRAQSLHIESLLRQAWHETAGGTRSPARPW